MVILFSTTLFLPTERLSNFLHNNASLGVVSYVTKLLENHFPNSVTNNVNSTLGFQNYVLYYIFATFLKINLYKIIDLGRELKVAVPVFLRFRILKPFSWDSFDLNRKVKLNLLNLLLSTSLNKLSCLHII